MVWERAGRIARTWRLLLMLNVRSIGFIVALIPSLFATPGFARENSRVAVAPIEDSHLPIESAGMRARSRLENYLRDLGRHDLMSQSDFDPMFKELGDFQTVGEHLGLDFIIEVDIDPFSVSRGTRKTTRDGNTVEVQVDKADIPMTVRVHDIKAKRIIHEDRISGYASADHHGNHGQGGENQSIGQDIADIIRASQGLPEEGSSTKYLQECAAQAGLEALDQGGDVIGRKLRDWFPVEAVIVEMVDAKTARIDAGHSNGVRKQMQFWILEQDPQGMNPKDLAVGSCRAKDLEPGAAFVTGNKKVMAKVQEGFLLYSKN